MSNRHRSRSRRSFTLLALFASLIGALVVSGCGGGNSGDSQLSQAADARRVLVVPGGSVNVSPSETSQSLLVAGLGVTIPGALLQTSQTLKVSDLSTRYFAKPMAAMQTIGIYDITLGSLKTFDKPLVLEFPYDAAALGSDAAAGKNLWVAYWDEARQVWNRVDAQADTARQKLVVTTTHLSYWWVHRLAGYQYVDEAWGGRVGFEVYYNPEDTNPRGMTMMKLAQETLETLALADLNYKDRGIPTPTSKGATIHAVLTNAVNSGFGRLNGQIDLKIEDLTSLEENRRVSAHQLFHVIQAMSLPIRITGGPQWLIDGTPDYMAYEYAWARLGVTDKITPLSTLWFEEPKFTDLGQKQAEPLGKFLKFLSEREGVDVKDLWFYVTSHPEDMPGAFRQNVSLQKSRSYESVWYDFIIESFFRAPDFLVGAGLVEDLRHSIFLARDAETASESFTMRANYTVTSTMIATENCNPSTPRSLTVGTTAILGSSSKIELWRWTILSEEIVHVGDLDGSTKQIDKIDLSDGSFLAALAINNDTSTEIPVTLTVTARNCSAPQTTFSNTYLDVNLYGAAFKGDVSLTMNGVYASVVESRAWPSVAAVEFRVPTPAPGTISSYALAGSMSTVRCGETSPCTYQVDSRSYSWNGEADGSGNTTTLTIDSKICRASGSFSFNLVSSEGVGKMWSSPLYVYINGCP